MSVKASFGGILLEFFQKAVSLDDERVVILEERVSDIYIHSILLATVISSFKIAKGRLHGNEISPKRSFRYPSCLPNHISLPLNDLDIVARCRT